MLENVGIKYYIGKNVGKWECGNLYIKLLENTGIKTLIEISGI